MAESGVVQELGPRAVTFKERFGTWHWANGIFRGSHGS